MHRRLKIPAQIYLWHQQGRKKMSYFTTGFVLQTYLAGMKQFWLHCLFTGDKWRPSAFSSAPFPWQPRWICWHGRYDTCTRCQNNSVHHIWVDQKAVRILHNGQTCRRVMRSVLLTWCWVFVYHGHKTWSCIREVHWDKSKLCKLYTLGIPHTTNSLKPLLPIGLTIMSNRTSTHMLTCIHSILSVHLMEISFHELTEVLYSKLPFKKKQPWMNQPGRKLEINWWYFPDKRALQKHQQRGWMVDGFNCQHSLF